MKLRETYLLAGGGHLWVVCSLPTADGSVVVLNFTSWKPGVADENCVISPEDHSFVRNKTVIAYEKGRVLDRAAQAFVLSRPVECPRKSPVSDELLNRIQTGALVSDLTPQKIQAIIRESMTRQKR